MALLPCEQAVTWETEQEVSVTEGKIYFSKTSDNSIKRIRFYLETVPSSTKSYTNVVPSGYTPANTGLGFLGYDNAGKTRSASVLESGSINVEAGTTTGLFGQMIYY